MPLTGAPPTLLLTAGHTCVRDTTGTSPLARSVPERAEKQQRPHARELLLWLLRSDKGSRGSAGVLRTHARIPIVRHGTNRTARRHRRVANAIVRSARLY